MYILGAVGAVVILFGFIVLFRAGNALSKNTMYMITHEKLMDDAVEMMKHYILSVDKIATRNNERTVGNGTPKTAKVDSMTLLAAMHAKSAKSNGMYTSLTVETPMADIAEKCETPVVPKFYKMHRTAKGRKDIANRVKQRESYDSIAKDYGVAGNTIWTTHNKSKALDGRCKLSTADKRLIKTYHKDGKSTKEIAAKFDVSAQTITRAIRADLR